MGLVNSGKFGSASEATSERALRIAVAPDSFKGTLSSSEAAAAIASGMRRILPPNAEYDRIPMADGGEGTVDAWIEATGAERVECDTVDPLGRPIRAAYGWRECDRTAVVELAAASGLPLLRPEERDPGIATTYGTGLLMRDAIMRGARHIVLGLGGSATNDAGAGILVALGARLLDAQGAPVGHGGLALGRVASVDLAPARRSLAGIRITAACDVTSPLCGGKGASAVFCPQKCAPAATPDALVRSLDMALGVFADAVARSLGEDLSAEPGAGAAGGAGFAVRAALGGALVPGARLVATAVGLYERVRGCALAISGEGRADSQTLCGKAPSAVAEAARSAGVPFALVCGQIAQDADGFDGALVEGSLPPGSPMPTPEDASRLLSDAAERLARRFYKNTTQHSGKQAHKP